MNKGAGSDLAGRLADAHYVTPDIAIGALTAWSIMGGYGARRSREDLRGTYEAVFRDAVETGKVTLLWYGLWTPVNPDKAWVGDGFAKDAYITVEELHRWLCTFAQDAATFSWREWWQWLEWPILQDWLAGSPLTAPAARDAVEGQTRKGPGRPRRIDPRLDTEAQQAAVAYWKRTGREPNAERLADEIKNMLDISGATATIKKRFSLEKALIHLHNHQKDKKDITDKIT